MAKGSEQPKWAWQDPFPRTCELCGRENLRIQDVREFAAKWTYGRKGGRAHRTLICVDCFTKRYTLKRRAA